MPEVGKGTLSYAALPLSTNRLASRSVQHSPVCPDCQGTGLIEAKPCQTCVGTGKVIEAIGRAERRWV